MARTADPNARIALLTAAEAVFAERGVAAAKVEEIARRAHVSKGAFYLHFDSKEDALRAVVESFLARCAAVVSEACDVDELPSEADDVLQVCLDKDIELFEFFWQNRATLAILGGCQGPQAYLLEAFRKDVETRTAQWIDALKGAEAFRADVDSELVSVLLCGAYHELVHKLVASPKKPPIATWLLETQAAFVRGLGTSSYQEASERRQAAERNPSVTIKGRPRGRHESV
ncbi:MAG: TetR/AcrR family transcriptional regulator [Myxococcales bacterium]|nr:TetR/AcrR family transcriptional regulator [Myxococcales bacterium]